MLHTHALARPEPPVEEIEKTPNKLTAAFRSLSARLLSPSKRALAPADAAPPWCAELYLDFLDDASLSRGLVACRAWHATATEGAWARASWARRCAAAVRALEERGRADAEDAACARAVAAEDRRQHCCGRGRFLALAYAPACQRRRAARRRRRQADAAARRWFLERRPVERKLRRATWRLRLVAVAALLALRAALGSADTLALALWPSRVVWRASAALAFAVEPRDEAPAGDIAARWRRAMPLTHALMAPDALDVRRSAFFAAVVLVVAHAAALVAWWRFAWYALGAVCADLLGLRSVDVARWRVELVRLEERSEARFTWLRAVAAERREAAGALEEAARDSDAPGPAPTWGLRLAAAGLANVPSHAANPYRGADVDAPEAAPPARADSLPRKAPERRALRSVLRELVLLHRMPLAVLGVSCAILGGVALVYASQKARSLDDGGWGLAGDVGRALAAALREDLVALALVPFKVLRGAGRVALDLAYVYAASPA